MHELLRILRCPKTRSRLILENEISDGQRILSGDLVTENGQCRYHIREGVPRFVESSNYADNFGMQWTIFARTQLDSASGQSISAERFWKSTSWRPEELRGKLVLDVGCGAGRFAEIALEAGARVVAVDYSAAVDACYSNLKHHENCNVVQCDIYALPFLAKQFDFVYSLGVLQHTPEVKKAFTALLAMVRPGGRLCIDVYERRWYSRLLPKYILRPITKRVPDQRLFNILEYAVPTLLRVRQVAGGVPVVGRFLKHFIPVASHIGRLPLNKKQHLEWALLDTFDWYSPRFDNPQKEKVVRAWFVDSGLINISTERVGHLVARGDVATSPGPFGCVEDQSKKRDV